MTYLFIGFLIGFVFGIAIAVMDMSKSWDEGYKNGRYEAGSHNPEARWDNIDWTDGFYKGYDSAIGHMSMLQGGDTDGDQ